ncbi:hypothetical protein Droror1_Dr00003749 [Drosera rotundifolia]
MGSSFTKPTHPKIPHQPPFCSPSQCAATKPPAVISQPSVLAAGQPQRADKGAPELEKRFDREPDKDEADEICGNEVWLLHFPHGRQ